MRYVIATVSALMTGPEIKQALCRALSRTGVPLYEDLQAAVGNKDQGDGLTGVARMAFEGLAALAVGTRIERHTRKSCRGYPFNWPLISLLG